MKPLENWTKFVTCKRIKTYETSSMTSHMNACKRVFHTNNPCMNFFHISGFKELAWRWVRAFYNTMCSFGPLIACKQPRALRLKYILRSHTRATREQHGNNTRAATRSPVASGLFSSPLSPSLNINRLGVKRLFFISPLRSLAKKRCWSDDSRNRWPFIS